MRWTENPEISVRLRGAPLYFPHVAELVDAPDLGSGVRKDVQVRVLSRGLTSKWRTL